MTINTSQRAQIEQVARDLSRETMLDYNAMHGTGPRKKLVEIDQPGQIETGWGPSMPSVEVSDALLGFMREYSSVIAQISMRLNTDNPYGCWRLPLKQQQTDRGVSRYPLLSIKEYGIESAVAHRALWKVHVDPDIAKDSYLDHLCHDHACCNLGHLEPVTSSVNAKRGTLARRIKAGQDTLFNDWHGTDS